MSGAGVGLLPVRLDNAQTFYAATLAPGPVALGPARLDNASALFLPTVEPVAQLSATLVSNSAQFFTATVAPGAVTLAPALVSNSAQFYEATAGQAAYTITLAQANLLYQVYLLHGLAPGVPLTVSQTQRLAGGIEQAITEAGGSVTISTVVAATSPLLEVGDMIAELAALHGIGADLVVSATQRSAGGIVQLISTSGSTTTVARQ